jgi:peptidoglycan/xylan/chitin deacetylase (PgdA/CDA1 family)
LIGTAAAAILLCILFSLTPASGSVNVDGVYFGAVNNEQIKPLVPGYMPYMINNKLLVPHFLLEDSNIGIRITWIPQQQYLTLSYDGKIVVFVLSGKAYDALTLEFFDTKMSRSPLGNDVMGYYLELDFLCEFFGWSYSVWRTEWGNIVRIKTIGMAESDEIYASRHGDAMRTYFEAIHGTSTPSMTPGPPGATAAPTPSPPPSMPPLIPDPLRVYITFDGTPDDASLTSLLDTLHGRRERATFFLTEEGLRSCDPALLRRLAATQIVGLCGDTADLSDPALWFEQAERMNGMLSAATFTRTRLTRWPALYALTGRDAAERSEPVRDALAESGYRLWDWTLDAAGQTRLDAARLVTWIIRNLPTEGPVVLRLPIDSRSAQALPLLLDELSDPERYFLREISLFDRPINRYEDTGLR